MDVTTEPKGNLVTPVAFNPSGDIVPFNVDSSGNLMVTGGSNGGDVDNIHDADNDTKIEVERTEDDDTSWFVNAGVDMGRILPSGIVDWFKQSAFSAQPDRSGDQPLPDTQSVRVQLRAKDFDIQNELDVTEVTGQATGTATNKLIDSGASFVAGDVDRKVINEEDGTYSRVSNVDSPTQLTLVHHIMATGEAYTLHHSTFTATEDGRYLVGCSVVISDSAAGARAQAMLEKNGATWIRATLHGGVSNKIGTVVSCVVDLVAGDYITGAAWQASGGPEGIESNANQCFLFGSKVG